MSFENILIRILCLYGSIIGYVIFAYIVTRTRKIDVSRRWKASIFTGVLVGLVIFYGFLALLAIGLILESSTFLLSNISLDQILNRVILFQQSILTLLIFSFLSTFISTIIVYINHWQTGDMFIEKYWRDPRVNYPDGKKGFMIKF
jgi:hypothetical protein